MSVYRTWSKCPPFLPTTSTFGLAFQKCREYNMVRCSLAARKASEFVQAVLLNTGFDRLPIPEKPMHENQTWQQLLLMSDSGGKAQKGLMFSLIKRDKKAKFSFDGGRGEKKKKRNPHFKWPEKLSKNRLRTSYMSAGPFLMFLSLQLKKHSKGRQIHRLIVLKQDTVQSCLTVAKAPG